MADTYLQNGFVVHDMAEYNRVVARTLGVGVPLEQQRACPACRIALETVCALVSDNGARVLRVGACETCGYIGHIERPAASWTEEFYRSVWDRHIAHDAAWVRAQPSILEERRSSRRVAANIAVGLEIDHSRPVLEIGCGYGNVLSYFRDHLGFSRVVGVEHSPHRAQAVSEGLGVPVAVGPFESSSVQEELLRHAPFSLIFSHHVFEHVLNGDDVIARAASLQREGDYFILAMPDNAGEHTGYVALYPPHLHSYSKKSIEIILNRNGYELTADHSPSLDNMMLVFKKTASPRASLAGPDDGVAAALSKFRKGFGVDHAPARELGILEWMVPGAYYDDCRFTPVSMLGWYRHKIGMALRARLGRFVPVRTMLVRPLRRRYTESPLEIQWEGPMTLLFK